MAQSQIPSGGESPEAKAGMPADIDHVPGQSDDLVLDELIEEALGPEDDSFDDPIQPAASDDDPDDDDDEATLEDEDLDDDDVDQDEEADEGEEDELDAALEDDELDDEEEQDDDELEDRADPDDEEEADGEEATSELTEDLTREELEEIKADPRLRKRLRSMEKVFTQKTQAVADRDREVGLREQGLEDFIEEIQTVEGAIAFLKEQIITNPELTGAAFEAVATDDGTAEAFLVEVGLVKPEAFSKAFERLEELRADEREMKLHERERDISARERKAGLRKRRSEQQARRQRAIEIRSDLNEFADREGIDAVDMPDLRRAVAEQIQRNRAKDPSSDIGKQELRQLVKDFGDHVRAREERRGGGSGKKQPQSKNGGKPKAPAKKKARSRNRVPSSGGLRRGTRKSAKADKVPEGVDPLDFAIERAARSHLS